MFNPFENMPVFMQQFQLFQQQMQGRDKRGCECQNR